MIMIWKIIQLLFSIGLIVGGLSGELVLRGTNSSAALVAVGVLWLIYDISQFLTKKKPENAQPQKQRKVRLPWFFILCGIYIVANLCCAFLLFDELNAPDGTAMTILAMCGNGISITGIVILLRKHSFGIGIALAGSAIAIAFTILSGIFIIGVTPHFDTAGFVGFMIFSVLPGLILSLQIRLSKHKSIE